MDRRIALTKKKQRIKDEKSKKGSKEENHG